MYPELHSEVMRRLPLDFDFKKQSDDFLQQGICPNCGKRELYTHKRDPWVLRCGRLNKCGHEIHIKHIYADLFESWSDRFPSQPHPQTGIVDNPNAAADAYMQHGRGFDLSMIKGWYQQGSYYCGQKQIGTATVKFNLANGCTWERFIDRPERFGSMKANFLGKYQGTWWQAPNFDLKVVQKNNELWLTEGIFDAIALLHANVSAVSLMSCNNFPQQSLKELELQLAGQPKPTLVFAFDTGKAGESFTKKFVARAKMLGWKATAAQPPKNKNTLDWNELLQLQRLTAVQLEQYRHLGKLLIATTADEKAMLIHQQDKLNEFPFEFDHCLYWFQFNTAKYDKANSSYNKSPKPSDNQLCYREAVTIQQLAKCYPQALYYQESKATEESWYYFKVDFPHNNNSVKKTFTGSQLSSGTEFKKRLLTVAPGGLFEGKTHQLNKLLNQQLYNIKRVQVIDYIGYSVEHKCYIFNNLAVKDGKLYHLNDEDFFEIKQLCVKSLKPVEVEINPDLKHFNQNWTKNLWKAFGAKGFVALIFWFGSFFAEQFRQRYVSYPFLEMNGEPGTGKTSLLQFFWKLSGRNNQEGFDPSKSNLVGRTRYFAQVSNLPVVLIEADRFNGKDHKQKGFEWDELKTAYNGRVIRVRGVKNNHNDTYEPPFRGAIVISQNADVQASPAILERIIKLVTDKKNQTAETRAAVDEMMQWPIEELSGFLLKSALSEKAVLACIDERVPFYDRKIRTETDVRNERIILNYSQMCALTDALTLVLDIPEDWIKQTHELLMKLASQRQLSINSDHPWVQEFWDVYEFLEGDDERIVNHSRDKQLIAVNLNQFAEEAIARKQKLPLLTELKPFLKTSLKYKFIGIKPINSAVNERLKQQTPSIKRAATVKCWVFEKGA